MIVGINKIIVSLFMTKKYSPHLKEQQVSKDPENCKNIFLTEHLQPTTSEDLCKK